MVAQELLRGSIDDMIKFDDITAFLQTLREQNLTIKLWLDNLIRTVFYMMLFVRAEREDDWPLRLYVVSMMIPYFFAAGHQNYTRYSLYYLYDMKKLPAPISNKFMQGEQVARHHKGLWNGIWTGMYIETTFM